MPSPNTPVAPVDREPSPRSVRTRRAVLDATAELLAEAGLAGATIDAIRDRSGVSKTTIYKHWPNRLCVAVDAFAETLAMGTTLPDTGTARGDFTEQLRRVAAFYNSPVGGVFVQLLATAMQDESAAARLDEHLRVSRRHGIEQLWNRAVARGEVRTGLDPEIAFDVLFGPVMWRLLSARRPLTEPEADQLVEVALNAILI